MEQEQIKNEITFEDSSSNRQAAQHHILEPSLNTGIREYELEDNISRCEIQISIINDEINEINTQINQTENQIVPPENQKETRQDKKESRLKRLTAFLKRTKQITEKENDFLDEPLTVKNTQFLSEKLDSLYLKRSKAEREMRAYNKELTELRSYWIHKSNEPNLRFLLPLTFYDPHQGKPALSVDSDIYRADSVQYGEYRYDVPAKWFQDAGHGNTIGWREKYLGIAFTDDGKLLAFIPPLEEIQKYPGKLGSVEAKSQFQEPFSLRKTNNNEWKIFCHEIEIPILDTADAKTWGELWPAAKE